MDGWMGERAGQGCEEVGVAIAIGTPKLTSSNTSILVLLMGD